MINTAVDLHDFDRTKFLCQWKVIEDDWPLIIIIETIKIC